MSKRLVSSPIFLSLSLFAPLGCNPDKGGSEAGDEANDDKADDKADEGVRDEVVHALPCPDPDRTLPPSADLCPPERQIAHWTGGGDCPAPAMGSAWTVEELFPTGPAKLDDYCRYLWTGGGAPDMTQLPAGVTTGPDCRVFAQTPLAGPLGTSYGDAFASALEVVPEGVALGPGSPVHTVVVDTAASDPSKARADHGPAIAAIVAAIGDACVPGLSPAAECQRNVVTRLGLPQVIGSEGIAPDHEKGGYFGYQSDLAQGLYAAYESWTNHDHKLVINLSVGWEPSGGDLDGSGAPTSPVLEALRDTVDLLRCNDAIVIAASGNQPVDSCAADPTGPGAWERHAAPDATRCADFGLAAPPSSASYRPLLYAATPLDWSGSNLANFRPGSDARMATLGFGGYATTGARGHGPLSGSSISSAALSGVASIVWSYFPGLDADAVMALIYASGEPRTLDGQPVLADFALAGATDPQHGVTVCGALLHGCETIVAQGQQGVSSLDATKCEALEFHCNKTWRDDASARQAAWWLSFEGAIAALGEGERKDDEAPPWIGSDCDLCDASQQQQLPADESLGAEAMPDPWLLPQPEKPPCPLCQIKDDDIYLTLEPSYSSYQLNNVLATLYDATGTSERLSYGALTLSPTTTLVVVDAELRTVGSGTGGTTPTSATVTMTFTDPATGRRITASNQVPIGP